MEKAIKKAIVEGYRENLTNWEQFIVMNSGAYHRKDNTVGISAEFMLLDPLFWQALVKGLGKPPVYMNPDRPRYEIESWKYYWHNFIDHLAEGKSIDSFFEELLK